MVVSLLDLETTREGADFGEKNRILDLDMLPFFFFVSLHLICEVCEVFSAAVVCFSIYLLQFAMYVSVSFLSICAPSYGMYMLSSSWRSSCCT